MLDRETIAENIVKFAKDNNLKIHPGQEPLKWADLVIRRGGHCPCVPGRDHCICDFVQEDIRELGRCRCGLFCNSAYIDEFNRLTAQLKGKRKWTREPRGNSLRKSV